MKPNHWINPWRRRAQNSHCLGGGRDKLPLHHKSSPPHYSPLLTLTTPPTLLTTPPHQPPHQSPLLSPLPSSHHCLSPLPFSQPPPLTIPPHPTTPNPSPHHSPSPLLLTISPYPSYPPLLKGTESDQNIREKSLSRCLKTFVGPSYHLNHFSDYFLTKKKFQTKSTKMWNITAAACTSEKFFLHVQYYTPKYRTTQKGPYLTLSSPFCIKIIVAELFSPCT